MYVNYGRGLLDSRVFLSYKRGRALFRVYHVASAKQSEVCENSQELCKITFVSRGYVNMKKVLYCLTASMKAKEI